MKIVNKKSVSILSFVLALTLIISGTLTSMQPAHMATSPFSDVPSTHWGIDGILAAYEDGVMTGTYYNANTGERQFSPAAPLTMAEWSVMLYRAWYADEPYAVAQENWWNREAEILSRHGIYSDIGTLSSIQFNGPASRTQMAVTIANLMRDKGITADAAKVETAKSQIADISDIFPMHQNAVATCWALGIINGTGGGKFDGNGKTERAAAATVYGRVKNVLAGAPSGSETPPETPTPPATASLVGTLSSTRLNLRKADLESHTPVIDFWAQQSMEIRNISDRDAFNAACQTIKDSKMIMTQGELVRSRNVYYHYAMVEPVSNEAQKNVIGAMGSLSGCGGSYRGYGGSDSGFVYFLAVPDSTAVTSAPRFAAAIAQINANPGLSDSDKAAIAVKAVCDQLSYQINGGASWSNGLEKGDCESYALMLNQILAAAGLPNINMAGQTSAGGHAWVQAKLDGQWVVIDGTMAETGFDNGGIMSFAEHESIAGYSGLNDTDGVKVARALIDAAYPTN